MKGQERRRRETQRSRKEIRGIQHVPEGGKGSTLQGFG